MADSQDQIIRLVYDIKGAAAAFDAFKKYVKDQKLTLTDLESTYRKTNAAGKTIQVGFTVQTEEGIKLSRAYDVLAKGVKGYSTTLRVMNSDQSVASKGMRDLLKAAEDAKRALDSLNASEQRSRAGKQISALARSQTAKPLLQQGFAPTPAEIQQYQRAASAIANIFSSPSAKAKDFLRIWQEVQRGIVVGYTGVENRMQKAIQNIISAGAKLGSSSQRDAQALTKNTGDSLAKQQALADRFSQRMNKIFGDVYLKRVKSIADEALKEDASFTKRQALADRFAQRMNKIFGDMYQKRVKDLADDALKDQASYDKRIALADKFGARMEAIFRQMADRQSNQGLASRLNDRFTGQLGGVPDNADPTNVARFTNALNGLTKFVAQGQLSARQLIQIFRNVRNGVVQDLDATGTAAARAAVQVISASQKMGTQAPGFLASLRNALTQTGQSAQSFTLSFKSIVRIAEIQALHTIMFRLLAAFQSSIVEARKFSIAIAEIQTISQKAQLSTAQWSAEVIKLSDAFGLSAADVAEGVYETISNQVGQGAKAFQFMGEAARFATIAVTSTENSVNLLTAVLNSFKLDVSRTREVADVLFKTIDLGRVRAEDMANTFGRVGVTAQAIGIKFTELSAAIAELTIKGVSFDDVSTQLTNVISKLAKPTDEMKKLLASWGVESGQAAIATFGFFGTLRKLEAAARSGGDAFAELNKIFQDIRAIRGAQGLIGGSALDGLENKLGQITNSAEQANEAFNIVMENTGKKLEIEFNKISNYFLKLGQQFNEGLLNFGKYFGSLSDLVKFFVGNLQQLADNWKIVVSVVVLYEAAVLRAKIATTSLAEVLASNPIGLAAILIGGIAAAVLAFSKSQRELAQEMEDTIEKERDAAIKAQEVIYSEFSKQLRNKSAQDIKYIESVFQPMLRWAAGLISQSNQIGSQLQEVASQANTNLKSAFDGAKSGIKSAMDEIKNSIKDAEQNIKKLQDSISDRSFKRLNDQFERSIALDDPAVKQQKTLDFITKMVREADKLYAQGEVDKAQKYYDKATELSKKFADLEVDNQQKFAKEAEDAQNRANEARKRLLKSAATSKKGQASGGQEFDDRLEHARAQQAAKDAAQQSADAAQRKAYWESVTEGIFKRQNDFEQKFIQAEEKRAADAKARLDAQDAEFKNLQELITLAEGFDKKFKNSDPKQANAAFADLQNMINQSAKDAGLSKDARLQLARDLANKAAIIQLQQINEQEQNHLTTIQQITAKQQEYLKSIEQTNAKLGEQSNSVAKSKIELNSQLDLLEKQLSQYDSELKKTGRPSDRLPGTDSDVRKVMDNARTVRDLYREARNELNKQNPDLTRLTELLGRLQAAFRSLAVAKGNLGQGIFGKGTNSNDVSIGNSKLPEVYTKIEAELKNIVETQQEWVKTNKQLNDQQNALNAIGKTLLLIPEKYKAIGDVATATIPQTTEEWDNLLKTLDQSVSALGTLDTQMKQLGADALNAFKAIQAASAAGAPLAGGRAGGSQLGGVIPRFFSGGGMVDYYAGGGFPGGPRGTDTVPTWLTPGESVLDAQTTRTYKPLIRALQSSRFNNYISGGNTTTVGDVTINVHANGKDVTARDIGNRLRREIHKGNLILS